MTFPIGPPPGAITGATEGAARPPAVGSAPATGASFARVYELEEARRRRDVPIPPIAGDRIPAEVWEEVEAAASLFDRLEASGRQVMFDNDRLTGRVVASLLEPDGAINALPLTEAVDPSGPVSAMLTPGGVAAAYGRGGGAA